MAIVQGPNDANAPVAAGDALIGRVKITDGTDVALVETNGSLDVQVTNALTVTLAALSTIITAINGSSYYDGTTVLTPTFAFANIAASQTDASIVTATVAKVIRVLQVAFVSGATATNVTFNTKPAGAGTAISPLFADGANGGVVLPFSSVGWFETSSGDGLTVTTGAGATTGILVAYVKR